MLLGHAQGNHSLRADASHRTWVRRIGRLNATVEPQELVCEDSSMPRNNAPEDRAAWIEMIPEAEAEGELAEL